MVEVKDEFLKDVNGGDALFDSVHKKCMNPECGFEVMNVVDPRPGYQYCECPECHQMTFLTIRPE